MSQAVQASTPIRPKAETPNPLDVIVRVAGAKLTALTMTHLSSVAQPDRDEAESLCDDLTAKIVPIVDEMLLALGKQARAHFGAHIQLALFTDVLRYGIEGNADYVIREAVEEIERDADEARDDYYDRRFYAA